MRYVLPLLLVLAACTAPRAAPDDAGDYQTVSPPAPADSARLAAEVRAIEALAPGAFAADTFRAANGVTLRYRLLPPLGAQPGVRYPLVVVFHGAGEMGRDNEKHLDRFSLAWARPEIRARYPAWVLAPQMPERSALYNGPAGTPDRRSRPAPPLHAALDLIGHLIATRPIDRARVYAVGFSMGASTVWNAAGLRPDLFAAAVPIAGVPNPDLAPALAQTPLWIVHGDADTANPIEPDRAMFARLRGLGAPVRFWVFSGLWHAVPPRLLAGDEMAAWLFAHRK